MREAPRIALLAISTFFGLSVTQSIVPTSGSGTFPACAVNCAVLLQAQSTCTPPNVATTNDLTYENCFCQSSLLAALYSTPDSICTAECTAESDRSELQTWFQGFCSEVGKGIDPLATTSTQTPTSTIVVTITSTSTPSPTSTGTGSVGGGTSGSNKSWIDTHWRWILMIAILIVGFALLAWLLVWLKRRHRRKVESQRVAMSGLPVVSEKDSTRGPTPDLWGPHQHMHHTQGFEYPVASTMGSGALNASDDRRDNRHSKRGSSSQPKRQGRSEMTDVAGRPSASRRRSSKGKARARDSTAEIGPEQISPVERDRSTSHRRRDRDRDRGRERSMESASDINHQQRLREVRGARRQKDHDDHS
ncbi:hypothetical protein PV08_09620 [Exophiala spinifera]|uniref:Extracellular membrane protein CFEM domain-containing protein n=1 Tax=Exophiala spinifera TaxID=91928 RepID=A0A0D2B048_9EURO|nr:uncharacterized protein PV08_09620 [Exophiala spinifera]KIW12343.1 hypothetical protein PV08_09620 [Exophiala spinifera]